MKCDDVMDWMQRYVDHDLGEDETVQMLKHIAECDDCAEKFEILRALSQELEQLPAVTPKFSLVDAIMPQLDAIDEARKEQSSTLQEMKPMSAQQEPSGMKRSRPLPWWNRTGGRVTIGVAAAAAVLGIVVMTYQPQELQNADVMSSQLQQEDKELTETSNGSGSAQEPSVSDEINSTSPADEGVKGKESTGETVEQKNDDQPVPNEAPPSDDKPQPAQSSAGDNSPTERSSRAGDEPSSKENGSPAASDSTNSKKEDPAPSSGQESGNNSRSLLSQEAGQPAESTNADEPPMEKAPKANPEPNGDNPSSEQQEFSHNDTLIQEIQISEDPELMMSITGDSPASGSTDTSGTTGNSGNSSNAGSTPSSSDTSATRGNAGTGSTGSSREAATNSPDGQYSVVVEGKKLTVYQLTNSGSGKVSMEVRTLNGTWVSGSWSDDSKTFTYETEQDGITSKYTYTVPRSAGQ
ncbi:hypothetical protein D3C74_19490 [compost metagenome]